MRISRQQEKCLIIQYIRNEQNLTEVEQFNYSDNIIRNNGTYSKEINAKIVVEKIALYKGKNYCETMSRTWHIMEYKYRPLDAGQ